MDASKGKAATASTDHDTLLRSYLKETADASNHQQTPPPPPGLPFIASTEDEDHR